MKYRAYDKLTNSRRLVRTIDFQFEKVQLVPPEEKCHLKWIRIFPHLIFEKYTGLFDRKDEEIFVGDILNHDEIEGDFLVNEFLDVYSRERGYLGRLDKMGGRDFTIVGSVDYKQ